MDSRLIVKRRPSGDKATIGQIFWEGEAARQCYTLEDVVREPGIKIAGQTAIPAGEYEIIKRFSTRFNQPMPYLVGDCLIFGDIKPATQPSWSEIMIHPGNDDVDTSGCILVGRSVINLDFIGESRLAFSELMERLDPALKLGRVYVRFINLPSTPPGVAP